jgi:SP family sugar:H+ symporter-like MFS transporter
LFVTLGIFVAYCINFGTEKMDNSASWRIPLGITFFWGLVLGIGILFFPESPRYDYRHGRADRAKRTMSKLYGVPEDHRVIMQEVLEIQEQLDAEKGSRGGWHGWIEMFQGPRMMYRIILGVVLQALQQLTGANYFFYYVRLAPVGSVYNNNPKLTPIRGRSSSTVPESVTHMSHR